MSNNINGSVTNPSLGIYPGSENRLDSLYGESAQAINDLSLSAPTAYSGANWEVEGTDNADEAGSTMYQVLNMRGGEPSLAAMKHYLDDSNASLFDTDVTSLKALARNARYADQVGNL